MYDIAICDDKKEHQEILRKLIIKTSHPDVRNINKFESGEALVNAYKNSQKFSIIFLDMKMGKIDGIQTAELIRKYDNKVLIIIVTSIIDYAIEGYRINAFDFILKPINEVKFKKVLLKALRKIRDSESKVYVVQNRDKVKLVKLDNIFYFESDGRYSDIYCEGEIITTNENITNIEKNISGDGFVRISRFYLLNMSYISEIDSEEILLKNGKRLRYSIKLQKNIKEKYMYYMMEEM